MAVEQFDGKKAVGEIITVEEIKPLHVLAAPRGKREGGRFERRGRNFKSRKPTVEDLDAELNSYMNNEEPVKKPDSSRKNTPTPRKSKPTAEDLDKELEAYMNNKPFPATGSE